MESVFHAMQAATVEFGRGALIHPVRTAIKDMANLIERKKVSRSIFRLSSTLIGAGATIGIIASTHPFKLNGVFDSEALTLSLFGLLGASVGSFTSKHLTRAAMYLSTRNGIDTHGDSIYLPIRGITNTAYLIPKSEVHALFLKMQESTNTASTRIQSEATLTNIFVLLLKDIQEPIDPSLHPLAKEALTSLRKGDVLSYCEYEEKRDLILAQQIKAIERMEALFQQTGPIAPITVEQHRPSILRQLTSHTTHSNSSALGTTIDRHQRAHHQPTELLAELSALKDRIAHHQNQTGEEQSHRHRHGHGHRRTRQETV